MLTRRWNWLVFLALWPSLGGFVEAKEGFGITKVAVQLTRIRPPEVLIIGTRIQVRSTGQGQHRSFEGQLLTALESEVLGNDTRLRLESEHPETSIEVAVLDHSIDERWESQQMSKLVRTGTDSKGKAVYTRRQFTVRFKVMSQVARAALKVVDLRNERTLLADTVVWNYDEEFQEGHDAPSQSKLELMANAWLAKRLAERLTPTREQVGVLVPKGSLKVYTNLAKSGLWNRYLEALESREPFTKAHDEAYRQYGLGTAYEALGYAAEEPEVTINYLEQAALHYNDAIAKNPEEKFFTKAYSGSNFFSGITSTVVSSLGGSTRSPARKSAMAPLERVETALERYQRTVDFARQLADGLVQGAKGLDGDGSSETTEDQVIDNAAIIEMARAGLTDDIILSMLDSAPATHLDASPQGLIQLAKGEVSSPVIERIQSLVRRN